MIVVKFGGSLTLEKKTMRRLVNEIAKHSAKRIIIVPGGGVFADTVRELDKAYGLPPREAHLMAILGMDQTGLLIASQSEKIRPTGSLKEIGRIFHEGKVPLILPSRILSRQKDLEFTWDVTGDSISAYLAGLLGSETLILLKDVDGVFDADPKRNLKAELIDELTAGELKKLRSSCVDVRFPEYVGRYRLNAFIINGRHPERLRALLAREKIVGTKVTP